MRTSRLRSRRLSLVAATAVVIGLTACGSESTDTSVDSTSGSPVASAAPTTTGPQPADAPAPIRVGNASTSGQEPAPAGEAIVEGDMSADTKMMAYGIEFVFDGTAGDDLTSPTPAWSFVPGDAPSDEAVAALAAVFGLDGPVTALDQDRGGGKLVGADDFSGPSITVSSDAMQTWWYSAGDSGQVVPFCEPPVGSTDSAVATKEAPGCETKPPANVPTAEAAEAATVELMSQLGFAPTSYEFETYADEWGASVNAYLVLDTMRTNVSMYFSFGAEGAVSWAGGFLATPERGDEYPRIGVAAAIERLNNPTWMGGVDTSVLRTGTAEDSAVSDSAVSDSAVSDAPIEIDPMPCDPAADCVPVEEMEPIIVHLSNPRPALEQLWVEDGTVWLLPAYAFDADDQGMYSVIAVDEAFLIVDAPEPAPEPTIDSVPLPDATAVPETTVLEPSADPSCPPFTVVTGNTAAPIEGEDGAEFIGLCTEDAAAVAEGMGYVLRVVREDGVDLIVTEDFVENRMNVAVIGGLVMELVSIG